MDAHVRCGDCLEILPEVPDGAARLIYLDPPFFTQKLHTLATRDRRKKFSFRDLWSSQTEYAEFLLARLVQCRRVLADNGSLFFHCDRRASHIARAILDEVFGASNFRSEIIWHYRRWSNSQKSLLPCHQTLYFYSKSDDYIFHTMYVAYSPSTNVDQILQRRKRDAHGKSTYDIDEQGRFVPAGPKRGVPLSDVWDIPYLNPKAKERVGYPTQKPILLLERIIRLVTDPGDLVLDPFCGSGTTLVAASLCGRLCYGIDISEEAVALTRKRLAEPVRTRSALLENGRNSYNKVDQSALAVLAGADIVPVHRNKGIDAILVEQFAGRPVPVRVQRPGESIQEAAFLLAKAGRSKRAERMIVVRTHWGSEDEDGLSMPPKVIVVESVAAQIGRAVGTASPTPRQASLFK